MSQVTNLNSNISKLQAQYGTSGTNGSTATKAVTCSNFDLYTGVMITVKFTTANLCTDAISLNVNSTGAKTVYVGNAETGSTNQLLWGANVSITFKYNGTNFIVVGEPRTLYSGTCSTSATTASKTATCADCVICKGTIISVPMTYANTSTSQPTLNISSTGAKNIYAGNGTDTFPTKSNGLSWIDGSTTEFVFDG